MFDEHWSKQYINICLTPYATQIRYPNNTFDITEIEAKKSLIYAKQIIDFVSEKIRNNIDHE